MYPIVWTFGENAWHPEPIRCAQGKLREGSGSTDTEILRCAQDDSQDTAQVLSREVFSPNVCLLWETDTGFAEITQEERGK